MIDAIYNFGLGLSAAEWWVTMGWPVVWALIRIFVIVLPIMGLVAYLTLWERKLIGWMQARLGPNRVGPLGLLQPIADALKLINKEIFILVKKQVKSRANRHIVCSVSGTNIQAGIPKTAFDIVV